LSKWATTGFLPGRGIGNFILEARGYAAGGESIFRAIDSMSTGARVMLFGATVTVGLATEVAGIKIYLGATEKPPDVSPVTPIVPPQRDAGGD
jgi:hypothetical protein